MKAMRSSRSVRAMRMLWVREMALLMLAVTGGVWLRFLGDNVGRDAYIQTAPLRSFVVALVMATAMAAFGLYQAHVRQNRIDFLLRLLLSFAFGGIALLVLCYEVPVTLPPVCVVTVVDLSSPEVVTASSAGGAAIAVETLVVLLLVVALSVP